MRNQTFVSLVVYMRDAAETIAPFLRRVDAVLHEAFEMHEIILVDDRSDDASVEVSAEVAPALKGSVVVIELARRHGIEAAIIAGLERSIGDFVFEMEDTTPDFDLSLLVELYGFVSSGFDIVAAGTDDIGWRTRRFYSILNRYGNLGAELSSERVRLVSRRALNAMLALGEKVRYRKALYALTGYPYKRVTYDPGDARQPKRRRLNRETFSLALDVLLSFSSFGLRVAHLLSVLFALFSVAVVVYAVTVYLVLDNVATGWTTLILVLSIGLAGLFFILGVIGEYLARILVEVRGRPLYAVRRTHVFGVAPRPSEDPRPLRADFFESQTRLSAGRRADR